MYINNVNGRVNVIKGKTLLTTGGQASPHEAEPWNFELASTLWWGLCVWQLRSLFRVTRSFLEGHQTEGRPCMGQTRILWKHCELKGIPLSRSVQTALYQHLRHGLVCLNACDESCSIHCLFAVAEVSSLSPSLHWESSNKSLSYRVDALRV